MKSKKLFKIEVKTKLFSSYIFTEEMYYTKAYSKKQAIQFILQKEKRVWSLYNKDLCDITANEVIRKLDNSKLTSQKAINYFLDINYEDILEYSKIMEIE